MGYDACDMLEIAGEPFLQAYRRKFGISRKAELIKYRFEVMKLVSAKCRRIRF